MSREPYRVAFELPGLPPMPNTLLGAPWQIRSSSKRAWLRKIAHALRGQIPRTPIPFARLTLTRFSSVCPDDEGLRGSFKSVIDSLTVNMGRKRIGLVWVPVQRGLGVLVDDKPEHMIAEYRWERCPPKQGRIRVVVEEVDRPCPVPEQKPGAVEFEGPNLNARASEN